MRAQRLSAHRGPAPARPSLHAQDNWVAAHDSAVETYGEGEAAHRVAFAAVKQRDTTEGDQRVARDEEGPTDPPATREPTTRRRSTDPDRVPTAGGKVAKTDAEARAKESHHEPAAARRQRR